jgi:hypothetical protein
VELREEIYTNLSLITRLFQHPDPDVRFAAALTSAKLAEYGNQSEDLIVK